MINSSETIKFDKLGFDGQKYIELQKEKIEERINKFNSRLYLEIGGKFMYDAHASRVLPGFLPESKKIIFSDLKDKSEIIFCLNGQDFINNRQISNEDINYGDYVIKMLQEIEKNIGIKPFVSINKVDKNNSNKIDNYKSILGSKGYKVYKRYLIDGYPLNTERILSENGFGNDDYIEVTKDLILVTGVASSSGKMSTCLGQIYKENKLGKDSGYAKYETFPIWNIDLDHPINLAYEAATADIGDFNSYDILHEKKYFKKSVNYNRDIEAFEIIQNMIKCMGDKCLIGENNFMKSYASPTDMGISNAGFCIIDDILCSESSLDEIRRRKIWYKEMLDRGSGKIEWIAKCEELENKSIKYIENIKSI